MNQYSSKKAADAYQNLEHKKSLQDETYPDYHLRAPSGWINDPCGLFYFNSSFHVFMQSNPWGKKWGEMSWSHVVSHPNYKEDYKWFYPVDDNQNFKTTAIIPSHDEKAADKNGIFTGCVKIMPYKENGETNYYPTAFYSAVWGDGEELQETVCIARALDANKLDENGKIIDPYLTNWTKYSDDNNQDNPKVVVYQPKELNLVSFRDPFIFNLPNDNNYYMLISAGVMGNNNNPKGAVICFKNDGDDITQNWRRVNTGSNFFFSAEVSVKDDISGGGDFECVCMYRLSDHVCAMNGTPYILIFSQDGCPENDYGRSLYYVLGNIVKTENSMYFDPLEHFKNNDGSPKYLLLDLSPDFIYYAANVMPIDSDKRNILMAWLNIESAGKQNSNWAGALAIPRFLFVYKNTDNKWHLGQESTQVHSLRDKLLTNQTINFINQNEVIINNIKDRKYNANITFTTDKIIGKEFGLKVTATDSYCTDINIKNGYLNVDNRYSCKLDIDDTTTKLELDIFLDGSSLEIFIGKNIANGSMVGFATYSTQLKTMIDNQEHTYIYADNSIQADLKVFSMQSCWIEAPKGQ
ncbi:hypothetical protein LO80_07670 [Candidatus Francisella endociliophora]|uniref:Beta-fructofuranosidase n=1 Tax=Candidatus Francisella endociliophora TaxID=653937 RepID=A0A097EQL0_9GAMM|nr:glycoside hydrolase family 32 protein [Francisella sp. FSC1006]AIT09859.1 hypothetical protein LO80_07670 [Francisella sp. FSC1006]